MASAISSAKPITSWCDVVVAEEKTANPPAIQIEKVQNFVETLSKSPKLIIALQTLSQKSSQEDESSMSGKTSKLISKHQAESSSQQPLLTNLSFSQSNFIKTSPKPKSEYFIKTNFQNVLTVEDGFYHPDLMIIVTKIFPIWWYFKPWDTAKTHAYYMTILEIIGSVKFKHFNLKQHHIEPAYSTGIIEHVLHPTDWKQPLHHGI
jgi:glutamate synthase domain-containing protein 3